jgi:hypothetical protein
VRRRLFSFPFISLIYEKIENSINLKLKEMKKLFKLTTKDHHLVIMGKIQKGNCVVLIQSSFVDMLKSGRFQYMISLTTEKEFEEEFKKFSKDFKVEELTVLGNPDFFISREHEKMLLNLDPTDRDKWKQESLRITSTKEFFDRWDDACYVFFMKQGMIWMDKKQEELKAIHKERMANGIV